MIRISISRANIERLQEYAEKRHPGIKFQIGTRNPKIGANDLLTEIFMELDQRREVNDKDK